ncbi:MAG TPA: glycosyl hydrolase, partial [Thermoanaerobaculia bacterium]|nr:glycosyl hydrolase [Thermoanaerobaculia bacterium]
MKRIPVLGLCLLLLAGGAFAEEAKKASGKKTDKKAEKAEEKKGGMTAGTFAGLELRGIGPALTSGRIGDIAVDPTKPSTWYVAVASGGVWKTTNAGNTFTPIFDGQPVFSIGCVTVDPKNPLVVWVGTGENNSQRSVSYGDGVYRSEDGGKSWTRMGLEKSEHIGRILVDPRDSSTVFVAAQGPLWAPGGDRGLYKTTDGGKTWKAVLTVSENTGVTDVVFDPENPDILYAAAWQRRRHV